MGARRYIPHVLLAGLTLLAVGALSLGIALVPTYVNHDFSHAFARHTVVPNYANSTLGSAATSAFNGASSFTMRITSNVSSFGSSGFIGQVRLIVYTAPDSLVVYQTSPTRHRLGTQTPTQITKDLDQYEKVPAGAAPWTLQGGTYVRTESLAAYTSRVTPGLPAVGGSVHEIMTVHNGYLVSMHLDVTVDHEALGNGQTAIGGVIHETYTLLRVNGSPVGTTGA